MLYVILLMYELRKSTYMGDLTKQESDSSKESCDAEPKYLLNTKMYYDDIHLNKLGHKHYGEVISKEILKSIKIN